MCIQRGSDLCNLSEILIDEPAQAAVIIHRAGPAAAGDEEFKVRDAECVLNVHQQERDALSVGLDRLKPMSTHPVRSFSGSGLVRYAPEHAYFGRIEKIRDGEM